MVDENGDGVLSITKTPFEITMKMQDPETKYVAVMLDANGDMLPDGGVANGNAFLKILLRSPFCFGSLLHSFFETPTL